MLLIARWVNLELGWGLYALLNMDVIARNQVLLLGDP